MTYSNFLNLISTIWTCKATWQIFWHVSIINRKKIASNTLSHTQGKQIHKTLSKKTGKTPQNSLILYNVPVWIALNLAFTFSVFFFFFRAWTIKSYEFTVQGTKNTVHALFTVLAILFTYLKIILLLYFQLSVFNFSKNKFNLNGYNI